MQSATFSTRSHRKPGRRANTVVLFTSDHGEYGASHGLRGKGAGVYEEGIGVPLIVNDPRGTFTARARARAHQLTSSVDVAPLLLTIGTGSSDWRSEPRYAPPRGAPGARADPRRPARRRTRLRAARDRRDRHRVRARAYAPTRRCTSSALRTPDEKYATYSHWRRDRHRSGELGQQSELYDYSNARRRLEVENRRGPSAAARRQMRACSPARITDGFTRPLPRPSRRRGRARHPPRPLRRS